MDDDDAPMACTQLFSGAITAMGMSHCPRSKDTTRGAVRLLREAADVSVVVGSVCGSSELVEIGEAETLMAKQTAN